MLSTDVKPDVPIAVRQLLVDVSVIAHADAGTGIQRVVRALWTEMKRLAPDGVAIRPVFATRAFGYSYAPLDFLDRPALQEGSPESLIHIKPGDIFLGLDLAAHLLPRHEEQIAAWKSHGATVHMLVYDMLPYLKPAWFRRRTRRNFRKWLGFLRRRADQLICISSSVAQDVHRWSQKRGLFRKRHIPVATFRLGSDIAGSVPSQGLPDDVSAVVNWATKGRCVLMVGTIEPRKAYDKALAAFETPWVDQLAPDVRLLIVGRPGWKTEALQDKLRQCSVQRGNLMWIDDASDEMLELLYAAAGGVLFASHAEGLGLPLLEAAAKHKPILARDLPVYRELDLPSTTYFDDDAAPALSRSIADWLTSWDREVSRSPRPPLPTWSDSASELMRILGLCIAQQADLANHGELN